MFLKVPGFNLEISILEVEETEATLAGCILLFQKYTSSSFSGKQQTTIA